MSSFPRRRQLRPGCTSGLTGRDGCRAARLVGGGRQARKQSRARGSQVWAVGAESPPLTPTWASLLSRTWAFLPQSAALSRPVSDLCATSLLGTRLVIS